MFNVMETLNRSSVVLHRLYAHLLRRNYFNQRVASTPYYPRHNFNRNHCLQYKQEQTPLVSQIINGRKK